MEAKAVAKYLRMSPTKIAPVADLVRGKNLEEALTILKQVECLGVELPMVEVVRIVDVLSYGNTHADKPSRTRRVHQRLHLVGGADKRGVATVLLDGLAVWRTEFHV